MYAVIRNNAAGSLQIVAYHPGTPLPFGWQVVFVGNLCLPASRRSRTRRRRLILAVGPFEEWSAEGDFSNRSPPFLVP